MTFVGFSTAAAVFDPLTDGARHGAGSRCRRPEDAGGRA